MPANVEIKARVTDLRRMEARARKAADFPAVRLEQEDVFFVVPRGRLKLRLQGEGPGELIYYQRPDEAGPKRSEFQLYPAPDPLSLRALLSAALGLRGTVHKVRTLYRIGPTRVHLDQVSALGDFVELEVVLQERQSTAEGERIARQIMTRLGIERELLVAEAYIDLLERADWNLDPRSRV